MTPYTTVTLGNFEFTRFEVPETMPFGVAQKQVVHKLVGGVRQIDALGPDPDDISWTGWLTGESALPRAMELKRLCRTGAQLALTWSGLAYTVTVQSAKFDFRLAWRIQYTLTCTVVSDDTSPNVTMPQISVEQALNNDLTQATTLAAKVGNTGLIGSIGKITTALKSVNNLATASLAQVKSILQPINEARAAVTGLMSQASTTLANLGNLASLGGLIPNPVSRFASGLASSTVAATQTGILADIDARLGRMSLNIGALTAGAKTVTTGATNLYAVASKEYGDAMAWTRVAQANGLTDPAISGITTLNLPAASGASTGGVLNA